MFSRIAFPGSFASARSAAVAGDEAECGVGRWTASLPVLGQPGRPSLRESDPGFSTDVQGLERMFLDALRVGHGQGECDWDRAAQALIDACTHPQAAPLKVAALARWCDALGTAQYPAFIGVLCVVGDRGSPSAMRAVANTLAEAICEGRLPSGARPAWGRTAHHQGDACRLGPLEYLCVDVAQPGARATAHSRALEPALQALLSLLSQSDDARSLYCHQLRAVAANPLGGVLSRATGEALCRLADAWSGCGDRLNLAVDAYLSACTDSPHHGGLWASALAEGPG